MPVLMLQKKRNSQSLAFLLIQNRYTILFTFVQYVSTNFFKKPNVSELKVNIAPLLPGSTYSKVFKCIASDFFAYI